MSLIRFLIAPFLAVFLSLPAHADKLSLDDLSSYLNGLQTVRGAFTQINGDGSISTGRIFIKRPGRVRFEYDPPEKALVLASANTVAIFDGRANGGPDTYALNRTPLSIILAKNVDLARADMVVAHEFDGTATMVTAQDPDHPEYGNIQLRFTAEPTELRQWIINDGSGGTTTVILGEMTKNVSLPNTLFNIELHLRGN